VGALIRAKVRNFSIQQEKKITEEEQNPELAANRKIAAASVQLAAVVAAAGYLMFCTGIPSAS
jgi:hypothetical protein